MKNTMVFLIFIFTSNAYAGENLLTLDHALKNAMANNPSIKSSRETANVMAFREGEAKSGYLPQAYANVSYKRATANSPKMSGISSGLGTTGSLLENHESMDSYNSYSSSVNLSVPIYDFGKTGGSYDSAKSMKNASEADLQETIENISYNVIQSYFSMLSAQESVAAAQETKMKMEKHLELAKAQLAAGIRQKIDVMRAQSDLASANLTLVQAKNALSLARLNLINAMGISKDLEFTVKSPENLAEIKSTSIDDAVRNALVKRPGYRSLKEKIQAAEGTLVAARSGYFPTIAASGNAGYTGYELNGLVYNWSAGLTMTWNFFSGFNTQNAVSEASANLSALQAELDKITLSIKNEVESAWINFSEAKEKIEPAEALLLSAEETLKMAEERYAAGAGNIVEVTDAQALYIQAKASRIQISYEFEIARAKFFKAVGAISEIMKGEN